MTRPYTTNPQSGSTIFYILIAVVLFAALTYALTRGADSGRNLSAEKTRLLASELLDTGNRFAEAVSRLRLKGVADTSISFENGATYANAGCTTDACKVFSFNGAGLEWEDAPTSVNTGQAWGFTGDIAIDEVGSTAADLVAFLPGLTQAICHRINVLTAIEGESAFPPLFAGGTLANKFAGAYNGTPVTVNPASIKGKKSGCVQFISISGTAVTGSPLSQTYVFYQVLIAR